MTLYVYNTLTGNKERFEPLKAPAVNMFCCGPTVQDLMHIGHARTYIFYDILSRYLERIGFRVNFIMNVTDIDESLVDASDDTNMSLPDFVNRQISNYLEDFGVLRITSVNSFIKVSNYINEMIEQTSTLLKKGYAYASDGIIYFDTNRSKHFGELSHESRSRLRLRPVELAEGKKDLLDFALWRRAPREELAYQSPWGSGWPGWHIQDTAVTISMFGAQYDIHGGAYELIYPHHEAEIAQAEAITGIRPFVKYWIHCGLVKIDGKKMSKSEGNIIYARNAARKYGVDSLRLYMMSGRYRDDMNYKEDQLALVKEEYERMVDIISPYDEKKSDASTVSKLLQLFYGFLDNDMDIYGSASMIRKIFTTETAFGIPYTKNDMKRFLSEVSSVLGVDLVGSGRV
ncbi:MAG: cysteine--tRNA ligase [Conexivisphaerales archaeon]